MKQPLFSVIVPVYNVRKDYLDSCIRSITNQTFCDFEMIIVNDGSKKEVGDLCEKYAANDSRIKVIHQNNQGVSVARNNGIDAAVADWIMFVDADDWIESNSLERLKIHLDKNRCDILLFGAVKEYAEKQQRLNHGLDNDNTYDTSKTEVREYFVRKAMQTPNSGKARYCPIYYSWDKVYNRTFLCNNRLKYPKGLPKSEDKVFILQCFEKMKLLHYVNDIFYHYRINTDSVCNKYSETADRDRIQLAILLEDIATRMDKEFGKLKGEHNYNLITRDYMRFIFGIISDVFSLKYFHPDYPYGKRDRTAKAKEFVNTEPFKTSIKQCRYHELDWKAKIKKYMLSRNLVFSFYSMHRVMKVMSKEIAEV